MLNHRQSEILRAIVQLHIETGEPVGSQALCRRFTLAISPATVRNAMNDLTELGYLNQPHASAGRVPTDQGYRAYVALLDDNEPLPEATREQLTRACRGADIDEVLQETSQALATLTHYACLVRPPPEDTAVLSRISFIRLTENRVMALLVSASGLVRNRVFVLESGFDQKELDDCGRSLSRRLQGMTLAEVRTRLEEELASEERDYHALRRRLLTNLLAVTRASAALIVNGRTNLLSFPELIQAPQMRELLAAMEETRKLITLLDKCLDMDGVRLFIGHESRLPGVNHCAVVAARFTGPESSQVGSVAVLGPTRLDYQQVIPLVGYTAGLLSETLSQDTARNGSY